LNLILKIQGYFMSDRLQAFKAIKVLDAVNLVEIVSEYVGLSHALRGKCPLHDGKGDNFALWPHEKPTVWTCHSSCGSGNAIKFIELKLGMTNEGAVNYLFDKLKLELPHDKPVKMAPNTHYSQRLADFCRWAHGNLMRDKAMRRITEQWGWPDTTLNAWQIGYNPKAMRINGASFGYHEDIYLSPGLVIPHMRGGQYLWANIRRLGHEMPKYLGIKGGRRGLFGCDQWQSHEVLVLTEGEKDAITGHYVLGNKVNFGAMGGSKAKPDPWDSLYLAKHKRIVTLYDNDKSGNDGAAAMGFEVIRLQNGDLTDYLAAHGRASTRRMLEGLLFDDDKPTADDVAWLADFNRIRSTIYKSDKVGKIMAVFAGNGEATHIVSVNKMVSPVVTRAEQVPMYAMGGGGHYYE
jgi:DNA primase